jgi:hypothetical protein
MLRELVTALHRLGRDARALRVIDAALAMPADGTRGYFEIHRAFEDALVGQTIKAQGRLTPIDLSLLEADLRFVARLTEALVHAAKARVATGRAQALAAARGAIDQAERVQPKFRHRPELSRAHSRALSALARSGVSTLVWCLWRRAKRLTAA